MAIIKGMYIQAKEHAQAAVKSRSQVLLPLSQTRQDLSWNRTFGRRNLRMGEDGWVLINDIEIDRNCNVTKLTLWMECSS